MKIYRYLKSIVLGILCLVGLFLLSSCANPLQVEEMSEILMAGDTHGLSLTYKGDMVSSDDFYFASEAPSVAVVDKNGQITAVRPGKTTIHMQNKDDAHIKTSVTIQVAYPVTDELTVFHTQSEIQQTGYSDTDHPFFKRNGYEMRMDDWDILAIVKLVASKDEDDYAFTDMYRSAMANDETFIVLSDWGNDDVEIDPFVLNKHDLSTYLVAQEGYSYDGFSQVGEDMAMQTIKSKINAKIQNMGYAMALSSLPQEYEYRVSIKLDYHVYRTVNFYSRGLVGGGWNIILDLIKMDISSFLNSYTYSEECYEIVLDDCDLVIERRPKAN